MPTLSVDSWAPVGVESLEPTALDVVKSGKNSLVVAGPGAGKTELLAQYACFLLQTGICPAPRRILAISFKKDAATNLERRVCKRCERLANRFDSLTLDAFAKRLVDRFRLALPEEWRPKENYDVLLQSPKVQAMREWIREHGIPEGHAPLDIDRFSDAQVRASFARLCHGYALPYDDPSVKPLGAHFGRLWWEQQLACSEGEPSLSFPMLNRLSALLLRQNPKLLRALQATYAYVFLDEFQDTTDAQYDLIRTAFQNSSTVMTAVGDSKQRIMVWAGALPQVFESFSVDFNACRFALTRNYRSAPELVRMQEVIAKSMEIGTAPVEAMKVGSTGSCSVLEFRDPSGEAEFLADMISYGLSVEMRKPRDYCILVRQTTSAMIQHLIPALAARGIKLRDETRLQDLLAEPIVNLLLVVLRLTTRDRDAQAWTSFQSMLALLHGLDANEDAIEIESECNRILQYARSELKQGGSLQVLPAALLKEIGEAEVRSAYPQYKTSSYLEELIADLSSVLSDSSNRTNSPRETVDDVIGVDSVPAMTIHKSKGLEFNTVIFLGLEDSQWWSFATEAEEEKRSFFVAFSRAEEQVYFTFSDVRDERWGRRTQRRTQIGDLYAILERAGVPHINCRKNTAQND